MVETNKLIELEDEHLLAHERLHVFQAALDLLVITDELKKLLPRQRAWATISNARASRSSCPLLKASDASHPGTGLTALPLSERALAAESW